MNDLITWLRAQLDADEQVARAASEPPWTVERASVMHSGPTASHHPDGQRLGRTVVASVGAWDLGVPTAADAEHIARWDPARVLAEVDAKRPMLEWIEDLEAKTLNDNLWNIDAYHPLLLLAQPYAGRDGWRTEWATTPS
jgi:hypothetical protein